MDSIHSKLNGTDICYIIVSVPCVWEIWIDVVGCTGIIPINIHHMMVT